MKKLLTLCIVIVVAFNSFGQTATSVADGNYYNPATWDCACIPTGGYTVNVNHNVVLDNDFALTGGSINIGSTGKLSGNSTSRYFLMTSGSFVNNGVFKVSHVALNGGLFLNNDSCIISNQFYCGAPVVNTGVITNVDSLLIMDKFINNTGAVVNAFMLSVNDTLFNDGTLNVTHLSNFNYFANNNDASFVNFFNDGYGKNSGNILFNDFSNRGIYLNYGIMHGSANATNMNYLYIDTLAQLIVQHDFSNLDSTGFTGYILQQGLLYVGDNFFNEDTITGTTGNICVGLASTNSGALMGTWDFCGLTNPPLGHVTLNTGYISPALTYCTKSCAASVSEVQAKIPSVVVYPNPSGSVVNFEFDSQIENAYFVVSDITGRIVSSENSISGSKYIFDGSALPAGLYVYRFDTADKSYRGKLLID